MILVLLFTMLIKFCKILLKVNITTINNITIVATIIIILFTLSVKISLTVCFYLNNYIAILLQFIFSWSISHCLRPKPLAYPPKAPLELITL